MFPSSQSPPAPSRGGAEPFSALPFAERVAEVFVNSSGASGEGEASSETVTQSCALDLSAAECSDFMGP